MRSKGRPKKSDELSIEKKKEVLDQYILMRKTHDYTQEQICNGLGYSLDTILLWSRLPEMKGYPIKIKNADTTFQRNDPSVLVEAAKKSLMKLIEGYEYVETTERFKNDKGNLVLVEKYIKKRKVEPDFEQIKWALQRLSPLYSDNSIKNLMTVFMNFTTYIQSFNPQLAEQIGVLINNYLASKTEDVKEITENGEE